MEMISMILGNDISKIVKMASDYQSGMADGVVQYNYETGEFFGAGFTTGTVENPANPFIEVFRLPQGEEGEFDCKCHENGDCPFWIEDENCFDDEMVDKYGDDRITCCINGALEDWDLENEIRESIESQIRDLLSDHLGDTISKLNKIRVEISDRLAPWNYFNVRQDNWEMRVLDTYVDNAIDYGFRIDGDPKAYLDSEIQHLAGVRFRREDSEFWNKVGSLIEDCDFDGALELLP